MTGEWIIGNVIFMMPVKHKLVYSENLISVYLAGYASVCVYECKCKVVKLRGCSL